MHLKLFSVVPAKEAFWKLRPLKSKRHVANTDWLKEVWFGGRSWILYCYDKKDAKAQLPTVFQESASQLKGIATFGKVDCWQRTASGKTLAHRFDFPKPPVVFAVANGDPPRVRGPPKRKSKTQPFTFKAISKYILRASPPAAGPLKITRTRDLWFCGDFFSAKLL